MESSTGGASTGLPNGGSGGAGLKKLAENQDGSGGASNQKFQLNKQEGGAGGATAAS